MTLQEVPDEDVLAEYSRDTLPAEFPVLMEDTGEITASTGEKFPEIVMEFSRLYFPEKHTVENSQERARINAIRNPPQPAPTVPVPEVLTDEVKEHFTKMFRTATEIHVKEIEAGKLKFTDDDIPRLRDRWMEICQDIMSGVPEKMPPIRAVNHRIPLIDEKMLYHYHLPRCPDAMKPQLSEKIQKYVRAGWWEPVQTNQAAPMLCIPKKTGMLHTAIDCRKRNANTLKDVTPFPDQDPPIRPTFPH